MSDTRQLFRQIVCRVFGHRWGWTYRDDGYPLNFCERCELTETWAGRDAHGV